MNSIEFLTSKFVYFLIENYEKVFAYVDFSGAFSFRDVLNEYYVILVCLYYILHLVFNNTVFILF